MTKVLLQMLLVVSATLVVSSAAAEVRRVDSAAVGANNGESWADAFVDLQFALAAASVGDEIWVANGTYTPLNSTSSFVLRSGVALYGGFTGNESLRTQRDLASNPTILSGDIGQDDTVDTSPFAPPWPYNVSTNTPNASHVVVSDGVDTASVLDGFAIVQGIGVGLGGGMTCVGGSPTVRNCAFADNFANFGHGGAINLYDSNASITDCTFYHNLAYQGSGGAIFVDGASIPTIRDCSFSTNLAVATYGQTGLGGAIQLHTSTPVTIERCEFDGNISRPFGGGSTETPRGGAIHSFCIYSDPRPTTTIRECVFRNNQAIHGGAVFVWNPTTIFNCSFDHNTATGEGAGICVQWTSATVINSTIANNTGGESGGISVLEYLPNFPALATIRNSIIWGNAATGQGVGVRDPSFNGPVDADNSCIQYLFAADPDEDPIDPANYPGCIAINPLMTNAGAGDVSLLANSPCIDAGRNSFVPSGVTTDLDGRLRFFDDPAVADTGVGTPPIVDMGSFERQPAACPGDVNGDRVVDLGDLSTLLSHFGTTSGAILADGDLDGDGDVDLADLSALLAHFGSTCQ